jgi:hypothetical protein
MSTTPGRTRFEDDEFNDEYEFDDEPNEGDEDELSPIEGMVRDGLGIVSADDERFVDAPGQRI